MGLVDAMASRSASLKSHFNVLLGRQAINSSLEVVAYYYYGMNTIVDHAFTEER